MKQLGIKLAMVLGLGALAAVLDAYQGIPWSNPYFAFLGGWFTAGLVSAIVTGMPEPTSQSSDWYLWAYRTGHLLVAAGTSFFALKSRWKFLDGTSREPRAEQETRPREGEKNERNR